MHAILVLLRKDFAHFRRDRGSLILTFVVPFALIFLFGQIFGVNRKDAGPSAIPLAVADASGGAGAKLVDALRQEKTFRVITGTPDGHGGTRALTEADLPGLIKGGAFHFAVALPADFASSGGFGVRIRLLSDPRNAIEDQTVSGLLEKTIFTEVPELLGSTLQRSGQRQLGQAGMERFNRRMADTISQSFGGDADAIFQRMQNGDFGFPAAAAGSGSGARQVFSEAVKLERVQVVGKDVKSPMATQLVGGWAMQFLLFALVASATSLFHEKEQGIFQRVLAGPVPRSAILWSKFLYGTLLGLLQMGLLFLAGHVLFGIEIGRQWPLLALVGLFAGAACSAFGMLLAALARSPEAARGMATFVILLMSAIGGAWFPVSFMPEFMQRLSRLTLVYWSIEGFLQVLWARASLMALLPTLGVLGLMIAVIFSIAWWRFRRGTLFDGA